MRSQKRVVCHHEFSCICVFYRPEILQTGISCCFHKLTKVVIKWSFFIKTSYKLVEILSRLCSIKRPWFIQHSHKFMLTAAKKIGKNHVFHANFRFSTFFSGEDIFLHIQVVREMCCGTGKTCLPYYFIQETFYVLFFFVRELALCVSSPAQ